MSLNPHHHYKAPQLVKIQRTDQGYHRPMKHMDIVMMIYNMTPIANLGEYCGNEEEIPRFGKFDVRYCLLEITRNLHS